MIVMVAESQDNADKSSVESAARRIYRMLDDAVECIGGIGVAAGLCATDRGDLRRGIDRNGRYVAVEHALAIGNRLRYYNASLATKLGSALVETFDLEVFPRTRLTDKERADRMEALIRRMPMGEQLLDETLGVRR